MTDGDPPKPAPDTADVAALLQRWSQGDKEALRELTPIVHRELTRIARAQLRRERTEHTLQTTALVNEAYMRLFCADPVTVQGRGHFVAIAARLMRQILVDYSRHRLAGKRDGGMRVVLEDAPDIPIIEDAQLIELDDALERLGRIDPRQAQIVELRFFGGLSTGEIAEHLEISPRTVARDLTTARYWLRRDMTLRP